MKRFHIHLAVEDLEQNIRFYSTLFHAEPVVRKPDYAKWMLSDPRINFAVSTRTGDIGVDHLGLQVECEEELEAVNRRLSEAALPVQAQKEADCCYARSDKYWTVDPQGIAWEAFRSLSCIAVFGEDSAIRPERASPCCPPSTAGTHRRAKVLSTC